MAILKGGILGTISGKIAGTVGFQWKDKNALRAYAIPANPNTVSQQGHRGKFVLAVAFAKLILGQVLNVFVDPFQRSMSGFNWFIKQNIMQFTPDPEYGSIKVTDGKLYFPALVDPTYAASNVHQVFPVDLGTNGKSTDKVQGFALLLDENDLIKSIHWPVAPVARSVGTIAIPVGALASATQVRVYLFAAQYDTKNNLTLVSISQTSGANLGG